MAGITEWLGEARRHQSAGHWARAEQLYQQVVEAEPSQVDAWRCLAEVCRAQHKSTKVEQALRQVLKLAPHDAEAHNNLGITLADQGKLAEATACFRQALKLNVNMADAHSNLGNALRLLGHIRDAETSCRNALRLRPKLASAHYILGMVLTKQRRLDDAVASHRLAVHLKPDFAEAHEQLGVVLNEQGKVEQAVASYRRALNLQPNQAHLQNNMAAALVGLGKLEEAVACYQSALRISPKLVEAHTGMGKALKELGKYEEAIASYRAALLLRPEFAEAHGNLAHLYLLRCDFKHGWPEYEWRLRTPRARSRPPHNRLGDTADPTRREQRVEVSLPIPTWDGSVLSKHTILLQSEQGFGDTIQFIRYAPLVKRRVATVILACQPELLRLLAGAPGVDKLLPRDTTLVTGDVEVPLLSVPGVFETSLDSIPAAVPYLDAHSELEQHWRGKLRESAECEVRSAKSEDTAPTSHFALRTSHFLVGIAWHGNPAFPGNRSRSLPVSCFSPLAEVPGIRLISLQRGSATKQLQSVGGRISIVDLGDDLDAAAGPFMDTAAVMKNVDLVISCDTAIPHLAGALGVPVWVALQHVPDWRWFLDREDSPWYPTMRLFRQRRLGDWGEVFARMAAELKTLLTAHREHPV